MLFFVIILCIITVITAILYTPLYIGFKYTRNVITSEVRAELKVLCFTFTLLPQKKHKRRKNAVKKHQKNEEFTAEKVKKDLDLSLDTFKNVRKDAENTLKFLSKKAVKVKEVHFDLKFGFEDAAATGIMTGVLNAAVYNMLAFLHRNITIDAWHINIEPVYNTQKCDVSMKSIIRINLAYTIAAIIKVVKILEKIKKNSKENN